MSNTMEYKGYTGSVEYSAEDRLLYGRLVGIRDRVLFDGEDVKSLEKNFRGAVDEYLAFCKEEGRTPDKPFKGSLNIRIPSELHRTLAIRAEQQHKSLNSVIAEQLASTIETPAGSTSPVAAIVAQLKETLELSFEKSKANKAVLGAHDDKTETKAAKASRRKAG
jgi:predicted HicB family RNase H-like nuclease